MKFPLSSVILAIVFPPLLLLLFILILLKKYNNYRIYHKVLTIIKYHIIASFTLRQRKTCPPEGEKRRVGE